ncbi:MAG: AI-2E family transporter [Actinobacteria bacterium]|nr:AI-2E family transporter [Actinomycetota bacterium]
MTRQDQAPDPTDNPVEEVLAADGAELIVPELPPVQNPLQRVIAHLGQPFSFGLIATLGVLTALGLGSMAASLSTIWIYIGVALFMAMALDPLVGWLEKRHMSRGLSITVVFVGFAVVFGGLLAIVIPMAVGQVVAFAQSVPGWITSVQQAEWFQNLLAGTGSQTAVVDALDQVRSYLSNPSNLLAIGGGALAVGSGIMSGITGGMFILILTLYFIASLRGMKTAMYRLAPAYARTKVAEITDHITSSVGAYISGMFILAVCNAVFSFILLSVLGVRFAALLAVLALFITMIPMIGSVTFWLIALSVCLFQSWWVGLVFGLVYFAYMQVEAYVMTPRVMSKQVEIPGSLVIISALVGGTLLGLLGALIAVPVTASLLMIVQKLFIPRQDAKLDAPPGSTLA